MNHNLFSIKSLSNDGLFTGYGSVFGVCDHQREVVMAGAFTKSLAAMRAGKTWPALLWMHDPAHPIGIWEDIREDNRGLKVQGRLALSTQLGREAFDLLKMGAVTGLSIGYRVVKSRADTAQKVRLLTELDLFEISLVTFPANDKARITREKAVSSTPQKKGPKRMN